LFLTTKVWVDRFEPEDLIASVHESLDRLRTDHVDLLLLHWPVFGGKGMNPTLEALMRATQRGPDPPHRHQQLQYRPDRAGRGFCGEGTLATNQVEYHVYLGQERLRRVMANAQPGPDRLHAAGQGPDCVNDPVLWEIGSQYGKTAAQVALRWLVEQDRVAAIPATSNPHHAKANIEIFNFSLSDGPRKNRRPGQGQRVSASPRVCHRSLGRLIEGRRNAKTQSKV
jgi:2,5-diketo-D-gluconate reductase B